MGLSNQSWGEIMRVVLHKIEEVGAPPTMNPDTILGVMRDNWELLCCHDDCCAYLAERDLAAKIAARARAAADVAVLDAEIEELENP